MTRKIKILIPEPCHENWLEMSPTEKGKFCTSCQKNVIDFTKSSDREIISAYNENEKLCGRFRISQLDREMIIPKEKKTIWMIVAASVIAFLGLGNQTAKAQGKIRIEQSDEKTTPNNAEFKSNNQIKTLLKGIVYDNSKNPLPKVIVSIKGTKIQTETNFDGEFSIDAKKDDILLFLNIGFQTKEFKIKKICKN